MTVYLVSLYYQVQVRSGANIRFDETAKYLRDTGWDVKMIVLQGETPEWCNDAALVIEFDKHAQLPGPLRRLLYFLKLFFFFIKAPRSIVLSDFFPFSALSFRKHYHYQLVHDLRNFTTFHRGMLPGLSSGWQRYQWRKAQKIMTVSEYTRQELVKLCGINARDIVVVYNGINQAFLNYSEPVERTLDFLFVGVFETRKNHEKLIRALSILKQKGVRFKAEFVGRDQGALQSSRDLSGQLGLEGDLFINTSVLSEEALIRKYNAARVFVSPALYEGFGIPLIEGFASGCTVACSDITVFREVCRDKALYFDPNDPEQIATALDKALTADRTADRAAYKKYAADNFRWEATLAAMDKEFSALK